MPAHALVILAVVRLFCGLACGILGAADCVLHFARGFLGLALGLHLLVTDRLAGSILHGTLHLVPGSFDAITSISFSTVVTGMPSTLTITSPPAGQLSPCTVTWFVAAFTPASAAPLPALDDQAPPWDRAAALARDWQLNRLAERLEQLAGARGLET